MKLYILVKTQVLDFLDLAQNANKMSFLFNFAKISKGCHFTVHGSNNLKLSPGTAIDSTFQTDVLASLLLLSFVCH